MAVAYKIPTLKNLKMFVKQYPYSLDTGSLAMKERLGNALNGVYGSSFEFFVRIDKTNEQLLQTHLTGKSMGTPPVPFEIYDKVIDMDAIYEL